MLTRRDLIHSRQFLYQRMMAALVAQKPDPLDWSGRRMSGAAFAGAMITVIAFAVTGIYALIVPGGNTRWQACDAPIVEKETGATFICLPEEGLLYPVANFSSARLFTPDFHAAYSISAASLTWPKGGLIGIAGAPDTLPAAKQLAMGAWSVCHRLTPEGKPSTILFAGYSEASGQDADGAAFVVADPAGARYLIWQGARHPVKDDAEVLRALIADPQQTMPVSAAWLDALPLGPQIGKITVPEAGQPAWGKLLIGQVVQVGQQHYVVWDKQNLRAITQLQAALLIAAYGGNAPKAELTTTDLIGHGGTSALETQLPPTAPRVVPLAANGGVCVVSDNASDQRAVRYGVSMGHAEPRGVVSNVHTADAVVVEPGHGVLVEAMTSATATSGTIMLVTDRGVAHIIPTPEALKRLGYENTPRLKLPSAIVARVPLGPALDHTMAGTRLG